VRETSSGAPAPESDDAEDSEILRAKYLDYCSAQVADVLVRLSPDEFYVLAQESAQAEGVSEDLSYERMVQLCTNRIMRELELPVFEEFAVAYQEDPAHFDEDLIGIWESEANPKKSD
jgi:hypothetical protein